MAKKSKAKARKRVATKDLALKDVKSVKGGAPRKAGGEQQEYMKITMSDALITGV